MSNQRHHSPKVDTAGGQTIRLGRQLLTTAVFGTISLILYLHFYGGGNIAVLLFVINFVLWVSAIGCGLIGPMLKYRSIARVQDKDEKLNRRANWIMIVGVVLSLLPAPWAFIMTRIVGSSEYVGSPTVMIPAALFLCIGFALILYRAFIAAKVFFQTMSRHRELKDSRFK